MCIFTMEYYSAVKESGILPFVATWVDLETHAERSESQKDKHHVISLTRGTLKKYTEMSLFTKQKQTHRYKTQIYGYQRGKNRRRDKFRGMRLTDASIYDK